MWPERTSCELKYGEAEVFVPRQLGPGLVGKSKAIVESSKVGERRNERGHVVADFEDLQRRCCGFGVTRAADRDPRHTRRKALYQVAEEIGVVVQVNESQAAVARGLLDGDRQEHGVFALRLVVHLVSQILRAAA